MTLVNYLSLGSVFLFMGSFLSWLSMRKKMFAILPQNSFQNVKEIIRLKHLFVGMFLTGIVLVSTFYIFPTFLSISGFRWARFFLDISIAFFLIVYILRENLSGSFFSEPIRIRLSFFTYVMFISWLGLAMVILHLLLLNLSVTNSEQVSSLNLQRVEWGAPIFYATAITTCFIAPFFEEIIFRGIFQNYFAQILGSLFSIVVTSLIFSFIHYKSGLNFSNVNIIVNAFIFSAFSGYLYQKTNSLKSSIAFHVINNTIPMVPLVFARYVQ